MPNIDNDSIYPVVTDVDLLDTTIGTRKSDKKTVQFSYNIVTSAKETTSNIISFERDTIAGSPSAPLTGDITLSAIDVKPSAVATIYHKSTTVPTIDEGSLTISTVQNQYEAKSTPVLNIIFIMYTTNGNVEITYRTDTIIIPVTNFANDAAADADADLAAGAFYTVTVENRNVRVKP